MEKLESSCASVSTVTIGMEATGHYWLSIYSFLAEHHFMIHVINPIQTDGWRKGTEIRKRKTDIIDSVLIADLMRYGTFMETSLPNEEVLSRRNLSMDSPLLTIPGIGPVTGACILGEIGDISRFSRAPRSWLPMLVLMLLSVNLAVFRAPITA